ncbi:unnamed protein product [Moneuplotes crassus]|uniref:Uncharacterized protein n=1 Tax=Euplotes crassus TaxID=5936 RepID=A0AAD1Y3A6_EUPCR|nr:unnamed protein product [Moneuplotes crassus]
MDLQLKARRQSVDMPDKSKGLLKELEGSLEQIMEEPSEAKSDDHKSERALTKTKSLDLRQSEKTVKKSMESSKQLSELSKNKNQDAFLKPEDSKSSRKKKSSKKDKSKSSKKGRKATIKKKTVKFGPGILDSEDEESSSDSVDFESYDSVSGSKAGPKTLEEYHNQLKTYSDQYKHVGADQIKFMLRKKIKKIKLDSDLKAAAYNKLMMKFFEPEKYLNCFHFFLKKTYAIHNVDYFYNSTEKRIRSYIKSSQGQFDYAFNQYLEFLIFFKVVYAINEFLPLPKLNKRKRGYRALMGKIYQGGFIAKNTELVTNRLTMNEKDKHIQQAIAKNKKQESDEESEEDKENQEREEELRLQNGYLSSLKKVSEIKSQKPSSGNNVFSVLQTLNEGDKDNIDQIINERFEKHLYSNQKNHKAIQKFVLLGLNFTDLELMQLFLEFSKIFDVNLDFQFDFDEFFDLCDYFCAEDLIGPDGIQSLINISGVKASKENKATAIYKKLYDILTDVKYDYISIDRCMPFLFIFHLAQRFKDIDTYIYEYNKILGDPYDTDPDSILGIFKKHGFDTSRMYHKQITYVMVENVIIDFRNKHLSCFNFEQLEKCQEKVKARNYQILKKQERVFLNKLIQASHYTNVIGKLSFGKWLCYELFNYIVLSRVSESKSKEGNKKAKDPKIIQFIKEEKICRIASVMEDFEPEKVNKSIYKVLKNTERKMIKKNSGSIRMKDYIEHLNKACAFFCENMTDDKTSLLVYQYIVNLMFNGKIKFLQSFLDITEKQINNFVNISVNFNDPTRFEEKREDEYQSDNEDGMPHKKHSKPSSRFNTITGSELKKIKVTDLKILCDQSFAIMYYTAEQKYCQTFMQLLLPNLNENIKCWIKSYRKRILNYQKGKRDLTKLVAYEEEVSLFRLQHYCTIISIDDHGTTLNNLKNLIKEQPKTEEEIKTLTLTKVESIGINQQSKEMQEELRNNLIDDDEEELNEVNPFDEIRTQSVATVTAHSFKPKETTNQNLKFIQNTWGLRTKQDLKNLLKSKKKEEEKVPQKLKKPKKTKAAKKARDSEDSEDEIKQKKNEVIIDQDRFDIYEYEDNTNFMNRLLKNQKQQKEEDDDINFRLVEESEGDANDNQLLNFHESDLVFIMGTNKDKIQKVIDQNQVLGNIEEDYGDTKTRFDEFYRVTEDDLQKEKNSCCKLF